MARKLVAIYTEKYNSQEGDFILDPFVGGGITLVEAKLLNRNIIGVDCNDIAIERCREKTDFDYEPTQGKVNIIKGDARNQCVAISSSKPSGSHFFIFLISTTSKI